jgi:heme/copper-type cytochrome/quinol oxidase subunit 2
MIEYVADYNEEDRPYICKKFTASSSEEVHTSININNTQERDALSAELIYTHMDNVIKYITKTSKTVQMIQLDENTGFQPWPLKGWAEIEWAKEECIFWWQYIYFKDNPAGATEIVIPVDEESVVHTHTADEDHTHDPETGAEVPDA